MLKIVYFHILVQTQPSCGMTHALPTSTQNGFISSSGTSRDSGCLWRLRALPGQRLNITLYDFSVFRPSTTGTQQSSDTALSPSHSKGMNSLCKKYAMIQDYPRRRETPVCGGLERVRNVFVSNTHQLTLRMYDVDHVASHDPSNTRRTSQGPHFFLMYQVVGCPRVIAPRNTNVMYSDKTMTVTCNITEETWYLNCMDNHWVGTIANCTDGKYSTAATTWCVFKIKVLN